MSKQYTPNDKYFYRAQKLGYRARSAFKLEEIQKKFKIIRPGDIMLDVGAAPGSFTQMAAKLIGEKGRVYAFDLKEMEPFKEENVIPFQCDVFDNVAVGNFLQDHKIRTFNTIISDLAPKTSGVRDIDQWRSVELNLEVLKMCDRFLVKNGSVLLKAFVGEDFPELMTAVKERFHFTKNFKPKACRDRSVEIYIIGMKKI